MKKRTDLSKRECPVARALDVVGEWWSLLVIRDAIRGTTRFDDFLASLRIARNVLSTRLRMLVERGVLERRLYQLSPPRHEYVLTEKGRSLGAVLMALASWGDRWEPNGLPPIRIVDVATGDEVEQILVSARTGQRVPPDRVRPMPASTTGAARTGTRPR